MATYVTALSHLPPFGAFSSFLFGIVEAGSAHRVGAGFTSPIRCTRRPKRKPCEGRIEIVRTVQTIDWACTHCDHCGTITQWEGSIFDLSGDVTLNAEVLLFRLSEEEYVLLKDDVILNTDGEHVLVAGAEWTGRDAVVNGSFDTFDFLQESVAVAANHAKSRAKERKLDALWQRIEVFVANCQPLLQSN